MTFYDTVGNHIKIDLLSSSAYISIKEIYNKTQAYPDEMLRCMAWNDTSHSFINDETCSAKVISATVPCVSCDDNDPLVTIVSDCRCKHLSRFAIVYQQTVPSDGEGIKVGLYSDFFAMNYWMNSFGLIAVLAAVTTYLLGIIIMIFWDRNRIQPIIDRLRKRMRNLEQKGFEQLDLK